MSKVNKDKIFKCVLAAIILLMIVCRLIKIPLIADYFNIPSAAERRKEIVVAEAAEYLKDTYPDDEFTYIGGTPPSWAYNEYTLVFSTKKYEDRELKVYAVTHDDNKDDMSKYEFYDTYFEYAVNDEAEKYFYDLFGESISEPFRMKIDYLNSYEAARCYDSNLDFVENYNNRNFDLTVYLFFNKEDSEVDDTINKIITDYYEKKLQLWVTRIVIDDINIVNNDTIQQIKDSYDGTFSRRKDFGTAQLLIEEIKHESAN